jgi:hypothetical protein
LHHGSTTPTRALLTEGTALVLRHKYCLQLSIFRPLNFPLLAEAGNKLQFGKDPK